MEHSDRGRYVTDQVSVWIRNDRDHFAHARTFISPTALGDYLTSVIRNARPHSSPWQVAQELAPNDYGRIDWLEVLDDLQPESE